MSLLDGGDGLVDSCVRSIAVGLPQFKRGEAVAYGCQFTAVLGHRRVAVSKSLFVGFCACGEGVPQFGDQSLGVGELLLGRGMGCCLLLSSARLNSALAALLSEVTLVPLVLGLQRPESLFQQVAAFGRGAALIGEFSQQSVPVRLDLGCRAAQGVVPSPLVLQTLLRRSLLSSVSQQGQGLASFVVRDG
ncbi:hypothetical protein AQJ66_36225 [Streptomyces bungoensis]|uniref:Uncharacterized protein n=1 Tax=Streptomyces bungoensis TaxID=285568 RepID=A0A117R7H2_9ACTN|nr:hypothetical protein AQJ66_36225 [Streptomyces bungoensis]